MNDKNELKPYVTTPEHAAKMVDWLRNRDGLAIWMSEDFSRPGQTITTPVKTSTGELTTKPVWWVGNTPACIITDPADVIVANDVEVKRFHVAVRPGDNGLKIKCTDGASRRIRREVEKAGKGAYYQFDYSSQDAVIYKPESTIPLLEYIASPPKTNVPA